MITSFRQVLVHLDPTTRAGVRLQVAQRLAQRHGAELCALYATIPSYNERPYALNIEPGTPRDLASNIALDERRVAAARSMFDSAIAAAGSPARWSHAIDMEIVDVFAQQALYADLMVLGQHDADDSVAGLVPDDFVEATVIASGKPALVVPVAGPAPDIEGCVLIAWKETPEAARAVSAALPLLRIARRVHVVHWRHDRYAPTVQGAGLNLDGFLRLHGISAEFHNEGDEPEELGKILMSRAFDLQADLLVMGCYGHSRMREWVLGGTTRLVLRSMTLPVLLAH